MESNKEKRSCYNCKHLVVRDRPQKPQFWCKILRTATVVGSNVCQSYRRHLAEVEDSD